MRLWIEAVIAAIAGLAATAILYSEWWADCCSAAEAVVTFVFLPGFLLGVLLGGGVHHAGRPSVYLGVAVEFVAVWFVCRLVAKAVRRKIHLALARRRAHV